MQWYLEAFKKYAVFSGRSRRKEYWMFVLFSYIIFLILAIGMGISEEQPLGYFFYAIYFIYSLASILPGIAVTVRRLHDINKSGWFYLISFIPLIGSIISLIFLCTDGDSGANQYGKNPKDVSISLDDKMKSVIEG